MWVRWPQIAGNFFSNRGLVILNQEAVQPEISLKSGAAQVLETARQYSHQSGAASRALGFIYAALGQEDRALSAWQESDSTTTMELVDWGLRAAEDGKISEAILWFERAARIDPALGDPWFHLGQLFEAQENWPQAAEAYQQGLNRGAKWNRVGRSNLLFHLGQLQYELRQDEAAAAALELFDRALEIDDFANDWSHTQTLYRRGEALDVLGRKEEAADSFALVIEEKPDDYWAYTKLGALTWDLERDAPKAEAFLLKALAIDDKNKFAYRNLGDVYLGSERFSEALEMYQKVLSIDPEDSVALKRIAEIHGKLSLKSN